MDCNKLTTRQLILKAKEERDRKRKYKNRMQLEKEIRLLGLNPNEFTLNKNCDKAFHDDIAGYLFINDNNLCQDVIAHDRTILSLADICLKYN